MNIPIKFTQSTNQFKNSILGYTNVLSDEINQLTDKIKENFKTNLSYKSIYKNFDNTKFYDVWIFNESKTELKNGEKKFTSYPYDTNQFECGEYINYYDDSKALHTCLVTVLDTQNNYDINGTIQECTYDLPFQTTSGDIVSYPCVVLNASQYNSGVDENKTLTIGSNQFMMYLPLNDETSQLTYDRRLFISHNTIKPIPYKVTRPDDVSKTNNGVGILALIMSQDQLNLETDNIELRICDYKEKPIIPINSIPIKYSGNSDIKIGNNYKTFTADTTDTVTWTVTSLITDLQYETTNNIIKIKCPFDESYIGMAITLKAETVDNSGEITLKVVGMI